MWTWFLKQTDKTISEVAAEVGFAIPGYFSACFKKQFGINPTELRDGHREVRGKLKKFSLPSVVREVKGQ